VRQSGTESGEPDQQADKPQRGSEAPAMPARCARNRTLPGLGTLLASLRILWAVAFMAHSQLTFPMPFRRNWRNPELPEYRLDSLFAHPVGALMAAGLDLRAHGSTRVG
jgi:hypothetical protein